MTRFKELSRIEAAIENKDEPELKWALSYCKMRISVAFNKRHVQAWRSREQAIEKAVQEFNEDSNWARLPDTVPNADYHRDIQQTCLGIHEWTGTWGLSEFGRNSEVIEGACRVDFVCGVSY
jgi:hypothetical protein